MKPTLVVAAFSPIAAFTVAEPPPACLLAALGAQGNPSGVENICVNLQTPMLGNITTLCEGDATTRAYNVFSNTCKEVGVSVAPLPDKASVPTATVTTASGSSVPADGTHAPTPTSTDIDEPTESKPASAAAAIAPHALLFMLLGLSTTGLFSIVFL
ncbi:hypothetical protein CMUS01_02384 [Colletotrichum musicola]|uniref:Extracellular membrane protein CFEM domain-containing protein n=1 Tax=Colletotrichum musicola TaxID=2175873 RepID=A0A8H6U7N3_9PEZI|nr:hypothetical protein CMUS01_02384 [Colletotrichum musicola]